MSDNDAKPVLSDDAIELMNNLGKMRRQGQSGDGIDFSLLLGVGIGIFIYILTDHLILAIVASLPNILFWAFKRVDMWRNRTR